MTWLALAVGVGSAVAKGVGAHQQGAAQQRVLEGGYKQADASRAQGSAVISGLLDKLGASSPGHYADMTNQQFMDQIRGNQGRITGSIPSVSGASSRYAKDVGAAQTGSMDFATRLSGLMARINAPERQRQQESIDTTRVGSKLSQIENFAKGNAGVTGINFDNVQPNPWLGLLTNAADAFASGYKPAASGGGKGIPAGGAGLLTGPDPSYASSGLA